MEKFPPAGVPAVIGPAVDPVQDFPEITPVFRQDGTVFHNRVIQLNGTGDHGPYQSFELPLGAEISFLAPVVNQLGPAGKGLVGGEREIRKEVPERREVRVALAEILKNRMGHRQTPALLRAYAFGHGHLRPGVKDTGNTFQLSARQRRILTRELKEELHSHRYEAAAQKYLCGYDNRLRPRLNRKKG
jgi:hypothetical protein